MEFLGQMLKAFIKGLVWGFAIVFLITFVNGVLLGFKQGRFSPEMVLIEAITAGIVGAAVGAIAGPIWKGARGKKKTPKEDEETTGRTDVVRDTPEETKDRITTKTTIDDTGHSSGDEKEYRAQIFKGAVWGFAVAFLITFLAASLGPTSSSGLIYQGIMLGLIGAITGASAGAILHKYKKDMQKIQEKRRKRKKVPQEINAPFDTKMDKPQETNVRATIETHTPLKEDIYTTTDIDISQEINDQSPLEKNTIDTKSFIDAVEEKEGKNYHYAFEIEYKFELGSPSEVELLRHVHRFDDELKRDTWANNARSRFSVVPTGGFWELVEEAKKCAAQGTNWPVTIPYPPPVEVRKDEGIYYYAAEYDYEEEMQHVYRFADKADRDAWIQGPNRRSLRSNSFVVSVSKNMVKWGHDPPFTFPIDLERAGYPPWEFW